MAQQYGQIRIATTPEEIGIRRKMLGTNRFLLCMGLFLFTLILVIVPKTPNNDFYLELNTFLDKYLLGYLLPKFSNKFYFSMKVAWCLSLVYHFMVVLILAWFIPTRLGRQGVKTLLYLSKYDLQRHKVLFAFLITCSIFSCFLISIYPYGFGNKKYLEELGALFYGHFIRASFLFLLTNIVCGFYCLFIVLMQIYYFILCTGEYRL